MAVDYTISAHPTMYRGVRFRSRLEATWAAFFDELRWQWEYEPFDLGAWSPDFLVKGAHGRDALVEIKPITEGDGDVIEKITEAAGDHGYYLLLCGVAPFGQDTLELVGLLCSCCGRKRIGCWHKRSFVKLGSAYDIAFGHGGFYPGFVTGLDATDIGAPGVHHFVGDEVMKLWAKAKNKVQWRPAR